MKSNEIDYPKVLVLCPHPDDFDVAGVTLKKLHSSGARIHVAVAPTYSGILDSFYDEPTSQEEMIQTREDEQRSSILFFGLDESCLQFFPHDCDLDENGELSYSEKNRDLIEKCLLEQRPDAVFIPHPNDSNPAHTAMYQMVTECINRHHLALDLVKQMDPKTQVLTIDHYTEISDADATWKTELFNFHHTQNHRNEATRGTSLASRIISSNVSIAKSHSLPCDMAEAFEIETHTDSFPVEKVCIYEEEIHDAFKKLTPQLADICPPTEEHLQNLIKNTSSHLFIMRDLETSRIIGTVTLAEYYIPTGRRAWIEDVILDQAYRGKNLAVKLMLAAEQYAVKQGILSINLTSSPSRVAANKLYCKLDYERRETNAYRKDLC